MKGLGETLFRKRIRMEVHLQTGTEAILRLLAILQAQSGLADLSRQSSGVLEMEAEFEERYVGFLESLDRKPALPSCWEDLFEIYSSLKRIFYLIVDYFNKVQIFDCPHNFKPLLQQEARLLQNVRSFFETYRSNHRYADELLKNYQHEVKELSRIHLQGVIAASREQNGFAATLRVMEVFEQLKDVNRTTHDLMRKVLIGKQP